MRKLKFRVWNEDNKQMIYFGFGDVDDGFVSSEGLIIDNKGYDKEEELVMEFTGLLDKQGKEIYEGDILGGAWIVKFGEWNNDSPTPEEFGNGYGWYCEYYENSQQESLIEFLDIHNCIKGNIYENKDLLKINK